ncbi:esterase [Candidatus Mycobacterium wuenschmannii]|uniref:Esterase n=1 Tax=Candidatus Mycobacterium wuenschmannii TaxID=3027808 RepID=A0ABY8VSV6_9MYCO|nr:esterase [Candidatus Mycobacterium wuenschmannii]WIM86715.1 esterase [Candidatus Mycobacterium wuenschmannii]
MSARRPSIAVAAATLAILGAGCSTAESPSDVSTTQMTTKWVAAPSGKFLLQGQILQKYLDAGGSTSSLGSPISNEKPAPGNGRFTLFEAGAIYWTPQTGAHVVAGNIRNTWEFDHGGPAGPLGYPTSDAHSAPGGPQQRFQHGTINDSADGHTHVEFSPPAAGS